jgi:hypothetical protein
VQTSGLLRDSNSAAYMDDSFAIGTPVFSTVVGCVATGMF